MNDTIFHQISRKKTSENAFKIIATLEVGGGGGEEKET